MKEEKEKIKNSENKIFNDELFVTNENEIETNYNSLPKSNSNSNRGSLNNNPRGSQNSNHSNNNEHFLSTSLMQNLDCSPKIENETKIEFDKFSQKAKINTVVHLNNCNINEDVLAKIKSNTKDQTTHNYNDLYEDISEKNDNININQLTQINEDKKINNNVLIEDPDLRSSGNSVNSNCNLSMNMNLRSSNIFNQTKDNDENQNNTDNIDNVIKNNIDNEIKNNIDKNDNKIKVENENNEIKKEEKQLKDNKFNNNINKEINFEYIFEKFGKRGWECEKCNNFNFETRNICNRCELPKCPKSLEQIKIENEQKSLERKKQPLVEREGDWKCPKCHNLNFAFRNSCNKCKLSKDVYLKIQKKNLNEKKFKNNFQKQPQIINNNTQQFFQNQFNFIQAWGFPPYYNQKFSIIPALAINPNYLNNQNNVNNNTANEKKYQNHPGNFVPKSLLMNNNKFEVNSFNNKKNNNGYNKFNDYNK